ncbi:Protein of unknown function [Pyronema omphalodes CBS 100304]|uniref:Uncharacterized protein n=1 Tax=Pyronema omphalodes (strain CBS 100304) TaxID=1076935 RepID=U4L0H5_PYROM|nr:Protein of unknown function [Pyronema omphalodes CBS 100304]
MKYKSAGEAMSIGLCRKQLSRIREGLSKSARDVLVCSRSNSTSDASQSDMYSNHNRLTSVHTAG